MPDVNDAVKSLYQKFMLRDIFSFITPGAILITSVLYLFGSNVFNLLHSSKDIHFMLYLPILGVFYVLGIFCMSIGAFIFDNSPVPVHNRKHFAEHLIVINDFNKAVKDNKEAQLQHERFSVVKQICGNNAVALFMSGTILLLKFILNAIESRWAFSLLIFSAILFLISVVLYFAHKSFLEQQEIWEDLYLGQGEK